MSIRPILMTLIIVPAALPALAQEEREFTDQFPLADCTFVPWGGNAYFDLTPGNVLVLDNQACVDDGECDEFEDVTITVTDEVRDITFEIDGAQTTVTTRVIEERENADGELAEISRNFFATCAPMGDVYYFGEDVEDYEDGEIVGSSGAWLAGVDGARPGIIMPDRAFLLGSRYFQEVAPDVALDRAEHVAQDLSVEVPGGNFEGCVQVFEDTPLEPDSDSEKVYCPGVGLVVDDDLELVQATVADNPLRDPVALSGIWYDPDLSGEGYTVSVTPSGIVIYYYGSDSDGNRLWLISETFPVVSGFGESFTVDFREATGGTFGAPETPDESLEVWGTLSGEFSGCKAGQFVLSGSDGDKTSNVIKLAGNGGLDC